VTLNLNYRWIEQNGFVRYMQVAVTVASEKNPEAEVAITLLEGSLKCTKLINR
jgi:hypothetical protein